MRPSIFIRLIATPLVRVVLIFGVLFLIGFFWPLLDAMRKFIKIVETTPNHVFAGQLSDIPID